MNLKSRVFICCVFFSGTAASAQVADNRTPEQMQASYEAHKGDFDYLLGDWEFTAVSREYGNFRGYWSAVRLDEGQILDEYRVVGDKGETYHVTSSLRNYNKFLDRWELVGADAGGGLQDVGTAQRVGAEMHIEQRFGVTTGKPSIWRIRYYNIQQDQFSWIADRSTDGGKTWQARHQTIEARRIGPPRSIGRLAPAGNAARASDSITGHWGNDSATLLELTFDGTSGVSGTAIWRGDSRPETRTAIKSGTFDPKTGAIKLEGEGPGRDGVMTKWVIDGRLVNDALVGDYVMGNEKGGFRFTRR
jgi:hypothetical protein